MLAIKFEQVSKRYRIGSGRGSLREAIPNLFKRLVGRNDHRSTIGSIWALKDVSFAVEKGEALGIIGRNGAGKTTILKLLSNITIPTRGDIQISGRTSALIELGAGFHPDLTGRENVYLNASILGLKKREVDERFDSIVDFAELEQFIDTPVKRYSSGMYVRLGFAVAVHTDPEILLVDEVLAVGDMAFQRKCFQRMGELRNAGTTIVLVSHNVYQVQRMCPRTLLMDKGKLVMDGRSEEVANRYLQEAMGETLDQQRSTPGIGSTGRGATQQTSGELTLKKIEILDEDGEATDIIVTREVATVRIAFAANETVVEPIVGVNFYTLDQVHISGFSNTFRNKGVSLDGESCVDCRIPHVSLLPGVYSIKVRVVSHDGRIILDAPDAYRFRVVSHDSQFALANFGLVYTEAEWDVSSGEQLSS